MIQSIIQIRKSPAVMHIDADAGTFAIRQPKADLSITTTLGELTVQSTRPELTIDQSRAWAAYNGGNMLDMNKRIYSGIEQLYLQGIAKRVEQGNRMAEFFKPGNTIGEVYGMDTEPNSFPETRSPASYDNVDIHIQTQAPQLSYRPAQVDVKIERNAPEIEFTRGKLDVYMQSYGSLQFIPPNLSV
ncbi:DUF6470 family protein [Paenibacillus ihuae]|uniref:DUF6470 family protein n=1 Tax=Paenibacillus ihuae TaxID=1232431 RepID=UPI0009E7CE69|nr:DUF6470 family protein [Paenibacillus ihuae]